MELGSSLDISRGLDTQMVIDCGPAGQMHDEILSERNFFVLRVSLDITLYHFFSDTETQIVNDDPIQSFEDEHDEDDQRGRSLTPVPQKRATQCSKMRQVSSQEDDDALQCLCGMNVGHAYAYQIPFRCQVLPLLAIL